MQHTFHQVPAGTIAVIHSKEILIRELQDALDLMAECSAQDAQGMVLREDHLVPGFFDLKTGLAGEILQKFSTYRMKLAIVGDFSAIGSKSLRDFIRESNRYGQVCFVASEEEAITVMGKGR
ncbi:MAG: DUF4180 domain-containing protein [Bacteroidales bacterium]